MNTLRLIKAAIKDRDIDARGEGREAVTDAEILSILQKMVRQREESAQIYDGAGRKELADWIVNSENPLTARVLVNRVWAWLFGEGLVRSIDNFGTTGEKPSHPELLDHLATRFVDRLPRQMNGEEFLARYGGTTDTVTRVEAGRSYPVRAATLHPVYENERVTLFAQAQGRAMARAVVAGQLVRAQWKEGASGEDAVALDDHGAVVERGVRSEDVHQQVGRDDGVDGLSGFGKGAQALGPLDGDQRPHSPAV